MQQDREWDMLQYWLLQELKPVFLTAVVHMHVPYTTLNEILPFPILYPVLLHCSKGASCSRHVYLAAKA